MEENERKLLKDIDSLHTQLQQEPNGRWKGRVYLEPSCYRYCSLADQLKDDVLKLRDDIKADYVIVLDQQIKSLFNSREILYVRQNMSNPNTEQVRKCMRRANQRIETLFVAVFQKINEMKQIGELP